MNLLRKQLPEVIEFVTEDSVIFVQVRKSQKAKKMRLHVVQNNLELVVPKWVGMLSVKSFLRESEHWIVRQHQQLLELKQRQEKSIYWRGHRYCLVQDSVSRLKIVEEDRTIYIPFGYSKEGLLASLRKTARPILIQRLEEISQEIGIGFERVTIRDQKTRWGSCSSKGTISLNWRLMMAPEEVMDYLIIHELSHRIEMNHSPKFWKVVQSHCPEFKKHEAWLKENGRELLSY